MGAFAAVTTTVRPDPTNPKQRYWLLYTKSFLAMRTTIGFIGLLLPVALFFGDLWIRREWHWPRGSLSAYYHSGMGAFFVGALCATGVFLIGYKFFERNRENTFSWVAGFLVLGVALFPSGVPDDGPPTPLQQRISEDTVVFLHFLCALFFILALAVICYGFGRREADPANHTDGDKLTPKQWKLFHFMCAGAIIVAVLFIAVMKLLEKRDVVTFDQTLWVGETAAVLAFGASWLAKGLDLKYLKAELPEPPSSH